jgi:hypothetical protein
MRALCLIVLLLSVGCPLAGPRGHPAARAEAGHNQLTPEEIRGGWILLFDGERVPSGPFGWAPRGERVPSGPFRVEDGTLTASEGGRGVLSTTTEFADFTLKAQVWIDDQANSGIFLRCPTSGEIGEANAYEVNIYDPHSTWPTGSINRVARTRVPVKTVGKWSDFEIRAVGDHLRVAVDGQVTVDAHDDRYRRGTLGLQYNGKGTVRFRDLRLRPEAMKPIFNGKDLSGWKVIPGFPSVYSVTPEGWLNVTNGPGEIQTEATYGDFLFQIEILSNGPHLNSGVFFREIPGERIAGYEAQIRNQWQGDDRTKPVDYGTGAIYRRQAARKVVSNDNEWFTMTIAAHGSHFATWVNAYQVTDFTDTRPEAENPRQGLRLKPGTLGLQGHDRTTNFSFRSLRIAELPAAAGKAP